MIYDSELVPEETYSLHVRPHQTEADTKDGCVGAHVLSVFSLSPSLSLYLLLFICRSVKHTHTLVSLSTTQTHFFLSQCMGRMSGRLRPAGEKCIVSLLTCWFALSACWFEAHVLSVVLYHFIFLFRSVSHSHILLSLNRALALSHTHIHCSLSQPHTVLSHSTRT